jgi:hypothetical protein
VGYVVLFLKKTFLITWTSKVRRGIVDLWFLVLRPFCCF